MIFQCITYSVLQVGLGDPDHRVVEHVGGHYVSGRPVGAMIRRVYQPVRQTACPTVSFATWVNISPEEATQEVHEYYLKNTPPPRFYGGTDMVMGVLLLVVFIWSPLTLPLVTWVIAWELCVVLMMVYFWYRAAERIMQNRRIIRLVRSAAVLRLDPGVMRALRYAIGQKCSDESFRNFVRVATQNPDEHPLYLEYAVDAARVADRHPGMVHAVGRKIQKGGSLDNTLLRHLYAATREVVG